MGWTSYPRARRASVHFSWTRQRRGAGNTRSLDFARDDRVGESKSAESCGPAGTLVAPSKSKLLPCRKVRDKAGATVTFPRLAKEARHGAPRPKPGLDAASETTRSLDCARDDRVGESKSPLCRKERDKGGAP